MVTELRIRWAAIALVALALAAPAAAQDGDLGADPTSTDEAPAEGTDDAVAETGPEPDIDGDGADEATTSSTAEGGPDDALAQDQAETEAADQPSSREAVLSTVEGEDLSFSHDRSHDHQFSLRVAISGSYVVAIKYADGPICQERALPSLEDPTPEDEEFCRHLGEPFVDVEIGFGVTPQLEITAFVGFGLDEVAVANQAPLTLGLGIRGYTATNAVVKGFFGARAVLDITPSDLQDWSDVDVGLRGGLGLQVDIVRWVGLFAQAGVTLRLLRGFYFVPDFGAGLQIRFP